MKKFVVAVLAVCCLHSGRSCDLCAVYVATEAQGGNGRGFFGGVAEQFTYFNTFQIDGHDASNEGDQYLNSSISQVYLGYNFNDRLGVQLNVPLIYRSYGYQSTSGSESGLGDVSLLGNVRLFETERKNFTFVWSGSAGIKFPTGSTSKLNPAEEEFAPGIGGHDLTLGSGSYDGLVGTGFLARWQRLFLTGAMQYAVRSEGDFGYQFANDWTWIGGPGVYLLLGEDHTLSLQAMVSGETKNQDTVDGAELDDTAITSVFLGPQVNFTWSNRLSAQLGGDLPVSIVSTGEQVVPNYRIRAAVTWRF